MLCTMCMFGILDRHCWSHCGDKHCPHILNCPHCGIRKYYAEKGA